MAIKLIANHSRRRGLPGSASHQFAVLVEHDPDKHEVVEIPLGDGRTLAPDCT